MRAPFQVGCRVRDGADARESPTKTGGFCAHHFSPALQVKSYAPLPELESRVIYGSAGGKLFAQNPLFSVNANSNEYSPT